MNIEEPPIAQWRATGLILLPGATFEEWSDQFYRADQTDKSIKWILGDALVIGESRFSDTWSQVVDPKYAEQHKEKMRVAKLIPLDERRESLSWSVHRACAATEIEVRRELLNRAEAEDWDTRRMAKEVSDLKTGSGYPSNGAPPDDSTWNPPEEQSEPIRSNAKPESPSLSREEAIRTCIEAVRSIAPQIAAAFADDRDIDALSDRIVGLFGRDKSLLPVALTDTDQALSLKPPGWRIDMEETAKGWNVRLRKEGAQFSLATGPHLPSAIIEACLGAILSDEAASSPVM